MKNIMIFLLILLPGSIAYAESSRDTDRLTTYAVVLGRCIGCGFDMEDQSRRVGSWLDQTFAGKERQQMLKIFIIGMEREARAQHEGKSPDSCRALRRSCADFPWP